jgi:hypothetical protein
MVGIRNLAMIRVARMGMAVVIKSLTQDPVMIMETRVVTSPTVL